MKRPLAVLLVAAFALGACGSDDKADAPSASVTSVTSAPAETYSAQVASYDLAADKPQRFLVGLLASKGGLVVGGAVQFDFAYQGAGKDSPAAAGDPSIKDVSADFVTVADGVEAADGPKVREGDESVGVYEALDVNFAKAGFWEVTVRGDVDGKEFAIPASFEVAPTALVPDAGDTAPLTRNVMPGDPEAPVKALDSRATADGAVPDPVLHSINVADAVATGKPTIVVISTPVFCVSRFCGPITDAVSTIAGEFTGKASFVHIEVWRDFEKKVLNKGAADWIYQSPETDASEPWVFLVNGDGTITRRWDNVANGGSIREALGALVA